MKMARVPLIRRQTYRKVFEGEVAVGTNDIVEDQVDVVKTESVSTS
jgi:hypothetical protein